MTIEIYLDAINGSDTLGNGSETSPYKTLQYFCDSVAVKNNAGYKVILNKGIYEITNSTIFGQFNSGNMIIIGKGGNTEIVQKVYMYQNSVGGSVDFSLLIAKCKYNILTTLTGANVNGFRWKWSFYNVLFEYTPNNQTSVFSTSGKELVFRNCVKLTNTTSFLRKNSFVISVYDSMGYFTSGYQTTQADWDKGGNIIGSIDNYMEVLSYQGEYAWITSKSLILHGGEYKRWNKEILKESSWEVEYFADYLPEESNPTWIKLGTETSKISNGVLSLIDSSTTSYIAYTLDRNISQLDTYAIETKLKVNSSSEFGSSASNVPPYIGIRDGTRGVHICLRTDSIRDSYTGGTIKAVTLNDNFHILKLIKLGITKWELYIDNVLISEGSNFDSIVSNPQIIFGAGSSSGTGSVDIQFIKVNNILFYKKDWQTVSSTIPSSTQFLEQGMDNLSPLLDRKITTLEPMTMVDKSEILGVGETGEVFSKTIDLKKYFDIRNVRTEV